MSTRVQILYLALAGVMTVSALAGDAEAQTSPGVYKTYTLVKTDLTVNEPVFVRFSVQNTLPVAVKVGVGANFYGCCSFEARIRRPDGRLQYPRARPLEGELVGDYEASPAPLATYGKLLLVNKWFTFEIPGRYILYVSNTDPPATEGATGWPRSKEESVVIDVGPRDPARLEQICADIEATWVQSPRDLRPAYDAAEALAYMDDPVAAPYIGRLFHAWESTAWMLVEGLTRMADGPAVDILISHASSKDETVRLVTRRALAVIEEKTTDPLIKLKIQASRQP